VQNCAAALGGGSAHALQDEAAAPSDGVTAALQESDTRLVVNRRPKISESGIAVKWASMRHAINQHFQALLVMQYDGNNLRTEACDRKRNLHLLVDAARHCMNEAQLLEFREDVAAECRQMGQPDGLRCVSMLSVCTLNLRIEIVCTLMCVLCTLVCFCFIFKFECTLCAHWMCFDV
jgi:hypothetical protein